MNHKIELSTETLRLCKNACRRRAVQVRELGANTLADVYKSAADEIDALLNLRAKETCCDRPSLDTQCITAGTVSACKSCGKVHGICAHYVIHGKVVHVEHNTSEVAR